MDQPISNLERARADLRRARDSTPGWADARRRDFDNHKLTPLDDAGARLALALKRAQEQFRAAQRLIG